MTAGPARVIRARAPKLAIRWKSMPMVRRIVRKALDPTLEVGGPTPTGAMGHCDGLSQPAWRCIQGCGACCRLDPALRPEALDALNAEQRHQYLAMVGADGWCIHFDTGGRRCRVYSDRPDFCRVENLMRLFGAEGEEAARLKMPPTGKQVQQGARKRARGRGKQRGDRTNHWVGNPTRAR